MHESVGSWFSSRGILSDNRKSAGNYYVPILTTAGRGLGYFPITKDPAFLFIPSGRNEEEAGLSSSGDSRPCRVPGRTCYLLLRAPGPIRASPHAPVPETQLRRSSHVPMLALSFSSVSGPFNLQYSGGARADDLCLPTFPVQSEKGNCHGLDVDGH